MLSIGLLALVPFQPSAVTAINASIAQVCDVHAGTVSLHAVRQLQTLLGCVCTGQDNQINMQ